MSKLIGKIIADASGFTEKLGGEKNGKFEEIHEIKVKDDGWKKFKQEVKAADGDEIKIKAAIDDSELKQLKKLDDLYNYAVNQSSAGKDVDLGSVNNLIQTQNYKNIADQAHGILGVKKAIDAYNEGIENGTLNTDKYNETISQSNSSLGNYLTGLKGTTGGIFDYGKSLATATVKTFALEAATMALNAVTSLGVSFLISAGISALTSFIDNLIVTKEEIKEAGEAARNTIDEINTNFDNLKKETDDVKVRFANLAQGVENLGKVNQSRGKLTTDDYEEFLDLSNQLADLFPQLKIGYDDNGNAILNLSGNVNTIVGSLNSLVEVQKKLANQKIMEEMPDVWAEYKSDLEDYNNKLDESQRKQKGYDNALKNLAESKKFGYVQNYDKEDGGLELSDRAIMKTLDDIGYKSSKYFTREEWGNGQYKINWDFSSLSEDDFDKIINRLHTLSKGYKKEADFAKGEIESANSKISSYVNTWLSDEWNYEKLSPDMQKVAKDALINSNWIEQLPDSVNASDWDDVSVWLQQNFLHAIYGIDDQSIKTALNGVLTNDFTVDSLKGVIEDLTKTEGFSKDNPLIIYLESKLKSKEEKINSVKAKLKPEENADVSKLSNEDLEIASEKIKVDNDTLLSWNELIAKINEYKNTVNDANSPISFSEKWNKLKESEQNSLKNEVLEGVLDKESISQYQDLADNFSLEQIRNEILSLIPLDEKLSQFIDDSEKLTSAYTEMKKNKTVSTKTLLGMPEGIRRLDGYTDFRNTVADPKSSKESKKGAFENIITEYLNANQTIVDTSDKTKNYVVNALEDAGITNAEALVNGVINCKDTINKVMDEIDGANETDVKNFAKVCTSKNLNNTKLYNKIGENTASMLNQLKDKYADDVRNFGNSLQSKLKAEKQYASAVLQLEAAANGGTSNAVMPNFFGKSNVSKDSKEYKEYLKKKKALDKANKDYKKNLAKLKKDLKKISIAEIDIDFDPSGKKKSTKETKTEIDWLSRRLTRMQSIIDLTASKLQNLFSVKAKNKNLNDQIKETTALMKQYGIAAKRYQKKADSIAAGKNKGKEKIKPLPKSIITQVKSGKITKKSYPKLIKKYGQSYADRINQYIDYYDKAKDAKKNKQDAKAKVRDLKQQKQQTYIDLYDSRTARAEAKENIQTNAKAKNDAIDTQIKNTNLSYDKQITIARKLQENKAEADRLKYEKTQKIKELHEKQLQNYADEYNAKADLAEINSDNAVGYQKQNSFINTQLSYLKQSNAKLIEIAKLNGDTTELDRLQAEYEAKKVELKQKQIENLKTDFENRIGFTRNDEQDVSNRISETEARGDIVQSSYYSALNRYEQSVLNDLNTELQGLKKEQNSFAKYSPEWYSLQSDIQSVENSISETNISIIENNKKIGELRQSMYDDIASRNNNAGSEAQFLAGLLGDNLFDDKTGSMTKEGLGVLGTYGIELEANTNTALSYANQRKEIEQAIASYNSGNAHALDSYGSLNKAKEKLNEAIKNQQEATTAEYATMKKIYDMMVKRYETQLAYMKSIIDAKKQVLSMEKDLYDYQKNISSQTKNIAALEKQLAALKGDDSEEGRAKRSRLQVNLDEANQELQDTEYERYISDQENMLDNMYTQYEDLLSELEKDFETVVKDGLAIIDANASSISTTLNEIADKYGYNPSGDMKEILSVMQSSNGTIVNTLPGTITNGLSELGRIFQEGANAIVAAYSGKTPVSGNNPDTTDGGGSGGGSNSNGGTERFRVENTSDSDSVKLQDFLSGLSGANDITKPLKRAKKNKTYESELNQKLSQYGYVVKTGTGTHGLSYINMFAQALGLKSGDGSYSSKGAAYKALKKKYPAKFRTGGIVRAKNVPKDGDFVPVRVNPDETILTQDFTKLLPGAVDTMKDFIKVPDYAGMAEPRQMGNTFGDIVINTELPNVKDSYDFANDLQNNRRTQRAIEVGVHDLMKQGKFTSNIQRF